MHNAICMVDFAVEMCEVQHKAGRKFVFEHPSTSSVWKLPSLRRLAEMEGMYCVDFDQCMFGQKVVVRDGTTGVAKKRTRVYTNSATIDHLLNRQCDGSHEHVVLLGGLAKQAAKYPKEMCDAMIDGILMDTEQVEDALMNLEGMCDREEEKYQSGGLVGYDDVSGKWLDPKRIQAARQEEMRGFEKQDVYHYVDREIARSDPEGKFVDVRWVDVNKGTESEPRARSRLVAQEYATGPKQDELYAPTPPLAAARLLLSKCASRGRGRPRDWRVLLMDIKKAFLYAKMKRNVYIELPREDPRSEGGVLWGNSTRRCMARAMHQ